MLWDPACLILSVTARAPLGAFPDRDSNIFKKPKRNLVGLLFFQLSYSPSWLVSALNQRREAEDGLSGRRCGGSEETPVFQEYEFQTIRSRNAGPSLCPRRKYDGEIQQFSRIWGFLEMSF